MDVEFFGHTLSEWISSLNIFQGVNFEVLYSWLPGDIAGVCGAFILFLIVFTVIGLLRRFLMR